MSCSHRSKTVLITGCSSGIIAALAFQFARQGLKVIATASTERDLQKLRESHRNITALRLDLHEDNAIPTLKKEVEQITGGGLDYLVNNAGAHYDSPAMDIDINKVRKIFEVNVFAVMQMCGAFSRLLIARNGVIVQIGSVTRDVPMICQSPYNATKAALSQYTRTLRLELAPFGVQVVEVITGYVQSNILRSGLQISPGSLYTTIKYHIENIKIQGNQRGMPASEYAWRVLEQIMQEKPPIEFWEGAGARSVRIITSWLPLWLSDKIWYRKFELRKLEL